MTGVSAAFVESLVANRDIVEKVAGDLTENRKNNVNYLEGLQRRALAQAATNSPSAATATNGPRPSPQMQLQAMQLQQNQIQRYQQIQQLQINQMQARAVTPQAIQQLQRLQGQQQHLQQLQMNPQYQLYPTGMYSQGLSKKGGKVKKPKTPKIIDLPQPDGTWLCSEPGCGSFAENFPLGVAFIFKSFHSSGKTFASERSLRSHRIAHVRRKKVESG